MKIALLLVSMTLAAAAPSIAQQKSEGRNLAELAFDSVDTQGRGYVDQGAMDAFGEDIRYSMDANDDGKITLDEWTGWDFGYALLAEQLGKELAYQTAMKIVFAVQDRDGDGEISRVEWRKAGIRDFRRADLNDDAILTKEEFLNGFLITSAIKAALKPE